MHMVEIEFLILLLKYTFSNFEIDNPKQSYAHLTLRGIEKYEMEKSGFKVWGLSLGQLII